VQIYLRQSDGSPVFGPFSEEQVERGIREGKLRPEFLVSTNQRNWHYLDKVSRFAPLFAPQRPAVPSASAPAFSPGAPVAMALPDNELDELADAVSDARTRGERSAYGAVLAESAPFMAGTRAAPHRPRPVTVGPSQQSWAIGGFICSLLGLFSCLPLTIAGIILSGIALSRMRAARNLSGKGLAVAGVIIGSIAVILNILSLLWFMGLLVLTKR